MMLRKILIVFILIILGDSMVVACICGKLPPISDYDYVAMVEVVGVSQIDRTYVGEGYSPLKYKAQIKTIEQFVGNAQDELIIIGGNIRYDLGATSCDIGLRIGEEWLIIGNREDRDIVTSYCTPSIKYKNVFGEIDYKRQKAIQKLEEVYALYREPHVVSDGIKELYYSDGTPRLKESFVVGVLHGDRKAYFKNGQVMLEESYKNGKEDGLFVWYSRKGKFEYMGTYKDGRKICEHYHFDRMGNVNSVKYYDDEGIFITEDRIY